MVNIMNFIQLLSIYSGKVHNKNEEQIIYPSGKIIAHDSRYVSTKAWHQ